MRGQESSIPVLCKGVFGLDSGDARSFTLDFGNVANTDEFLSLGAQFREFKIKSIRYEVFHQVASFAQPIVMSTYHDLTGNITHTQDTVLDGEDSQYMDAGAGKQVFYWTANGVPENEYQATSAFTSFGGLRIWRDTNAVNPNLRQVTIVWTAVVVFRGRV